MATYYVDEANGNDADDGLNPIPLGGGVGPKATLNGAEDIPVIADDFVWVRPGVYRDMLTVDVSGGAGTPIIYQGDVLGEIWGVGGIVRITGSDNDQAAVRANCITADGRDYRTFRGFYFDTTTSHLLVIQNPEHWIIEDCVIGAAATGGGCLISGATINDMNIRRCLFESTRAALPPLEFNSAAGIQDVASTVQSCTFPGNYLALIELDDVGGVTVRNCNFMAAARGVQVIDSPPVGFTANVVENCILTSCNEALRAVALGEIVEDFNTFFANTVNRTNVAVGANSQTYPPLHLPPILHSGIGQASGYKIPWWFGELSEWSQVRAITGNNEPTEDFFGMLRPTTAAKNSWGAIQFHDMERETVTTFDASAASMRLADAGVHQLFVPVTAASTIFRVRVYREANYAGVNPRMVIKQPGQADDVTTDVGAAGAWNLLTTTLTLSADTDFVVVELQSLNTAVAGNYDVFFDNLEVR